MCKILHISVSILGKVKINVNNAFRWPDLATCDIFNETKVADWKNCFKKRMQYGRKTHQLIQSMSPRLIKTDELSDSDLCEFAELSSGDKFALRFMIDELMQCVHHEER